jgi:Ni,Fe-hydrogenase III small subunit
VFGHRASQHSVWLFPLNSGSCNGCEQEIQALHAARYALEEGGIAFASSPRHADILLLTGIMTPRSQAAARRVWEQLAEPRAIVAVGDCPINGSVFGGQEGFTPAGETLPIDVELPGCPPSPTLLLEAIAAAIKLLDQEVAGEEEEEEEAGATESEEEGEEEAPSSESESEEAEVSDDQGRQDKP